MRFSPLLISATIIEPLRYFFKFYTKGQGLIWDEDEKIRTVDIGTVNDFHQIAPQRKPRILVDRGSYMISKTGLTDNLAEAKGIKELYGKSDRTNQVWIDGQAQIIIEAWKEGTCELLADMVSHFIVWSRPLLCDTQGFNEFGLGMQVSSCQPDKEDKEKFKVNIAFPYRMEEHWNVTWDSIKIKSFLTTIRPYDPNNSSYGTLLERVIMKG